jgi:signal transduction histidine kinase
MTVDVPDIGVPAGSSAIIRGTITDESAGAKGTPAISDESMSEWMQYLYMQFPKPTNATGVPILLSAIDPNGNYLEIGVTTSDASGTFSYRWIPPSDIPGKYTVIASFAGSNSYWPSYAETAMSVDTTTKPTTATTTQPTSAIETYFVPAVAGIAVLIIACFAITLLVLRKRQ